ncbi:MAG TPA: hypothetical protein VGM10_16835 [Actinocrinis sp.]|jgi:hypothetical protein
MENTSVKPSWLRRMTRRGVVVGATSIVAIGAAAAIASPASAAETKQASQPAVCAIATAGLGDLVAQPACV